MAVIIKDKVLYSTVPGPSTEGPLEKSFLDLMFDCIKRDLAETGDRDWIIDIDPLENGRKRICRIGEIQATARRAASALQRSGVGRGDVIQIVLPNDVHYYFPIFGAWLIGAYVSVSDPGLKSEVLLEQLEETKGKIIFCHKETIEKFANKTDKEIIVMPEGPERTLEKMEKVSSWEDFLTRGIDNDPNIENLVSKSYDDTAIIFWSSGTTGKPKGIQHTQRFLLNTITKSRFSSAALLQSTCFYHTGGFLCPLDAGLYNKFLNPFLNANRGITTDAILEGCHKYQPNVLMVGSHHALQIASVPVRKDLNLNSVLAVAPMGAAVHVGLMDELKQHFPNMIGGVLGFYGMSEVGTVSRAYSPAVLGILAPGCQAKIVDPLTGELQGPNQVGEIIVKTPCIMKGYLNRPEENQNFFFGDGFIRTGDLGYYDEKGVLFYHDRLKELIKYNNIHVYPSSIEDILYQHEDVIEAGVFGRPDPRVQELVTAVVVKQPSSKITEQELIDYVNEKLDEYKKIRGGLKFVESIPRNPQGKILKPQLRALFD